MASSTEQRSSRFGQDIAINVSRKSFLRALSNIIDNAVEALSEKEGKVLIQMNTTHQEISIEIHDDGKGIPSEVLPKLMAEGATFNKDGGSGLGLAYAKKTVDALKGSLRIGSQEGEGTTVTLRFPTQTPPTWFKEAIQLEPQTTVIVVDDDISIHQIWAGRFQSLKAKENKIDLIRFSTLKEADEFQIRARESLGRRFYLVDFEFIGFEGTGLDWIKKHHLEGQSVLVTSRSEEPHLRKKCEGLHLKMLPKALSPYIPLNIKKIDIVASGLHSQEGSRPSLKPQEGVLTL